MSSGGNSSNLAVNCQLTLNYAIYIHGIQSDYFFILNSNASFMHSFTNFKHAIVSFTCNCELNMLLSVVGMQLSVFGASSPVVGVPLSF